MMNRTSIAYLHTGGRLGNAMSSYATMIALRHQFGMDAMVDLTTYQILDMVFSHVREVPIIEERVCLTRNLSWTFFDDHIRNFNASSLKSGKAIFFWPHGIASEEHTRTSSATVAKHLGYTECIYIQVRRRLLDFQIFILNHLSDKDLYLK